MLEHPYQIITTLGLALTPDKYLTRAERKALYDRDNTEVFIEHEEDNKHDHLALIVYKKVNFNKVKIGYVLKNYYDDGEHYEMSDDIARNIVNNNEYFELNMQDRIYINKENMKNIERDNPRFFLKLFERN